MAQRGLGGAVITLIVVDAILVVVLIALLITHPRPPAEPELSPTEPAATQEAQPGPEDQDDDEAGQEQNGEPAETPPGNALDEAAFATPSRNIWCQIGAEEVTCTIGGHEYQPPEQPDCAGQYGRVLTLSAEEATMPCLSEAPPTTAPESLPDLDYGQSTVVHDFWCDSQETGVTCRSVQTGRGFTLAYREVSTF